MVALWIRAGTMLAGDGPLDVRLLAPFATALGTVLLFRAAEDLLPNRGAGLTAATLLNATLLMGIGAVTMTPDTPLLLFWTATLWALGRMLATGRREWWLASGAAAGLALDSKIHRAVAAALHRRLDRHGAAVAPPLAATAAAVGRRRQSPPYCFRPC